MSNRKKGSIPFFLMIKSFLIVLSFYLIVYIGTVESANGIIVLNPESKLYSEASAATLIWKGAILEKDFKVLLTFALPEYYDGVIKGLHDEKSEMYRILYGSKDSTFNLFRKKYLKIAHLEDRRYPISGKAFIACFYDSSQIDPKTEEEILKLRSSQDKTKVYCHYFFKTEGHWYANWELWYGDDE